MLIDWFTVAAQIVNFVILVVLLKYLLYDRVIRAMDQREHRIAEQLNEAERAREEARKQAQEHDRARRDIEDSRQDLIDKARQEAQTRREELEEEARKDVARQKDRWLADLKRNQDRFIADLRQLVSRRLVGIARKALADLADSELEDRIVTVFCERLADADEEQIDAMKQSAGKDKSVTVHSAFELSDEQKQAVTKTLSSRAGRDNPQFERTEDLVCGLEVRFDGHAISWNLRHFVDNLADDIRNRLTEEAANGRSEKDQTETDSGEQSPEGEGDQE